MGCRQWPASRPALHASAAAVTAPASSDSVFNEKPDDRTGRNNIFLIIVITLGIKRNFLNLGCRQIQLPAEDLAAGSTPGAQLPRHCSGSTDLVGRRQRPCMAAAILLIILYCQYYCRASLPLSRCTSVVALRGAAAVVVPVQH